MCSPNAEGLVEPNSRRLGGEGPLLGGLVLLFVNLGCCPFGQAPGFTIRGGIANSGQRPSRSAAYFSSRGSCPLGWGTALATVTTSSISQPLLFCKNVPFSTSMGPQPGPSGMSVEHILGLVESDHDMGHLLQFLTIGQPRARAKRRSGKGSEWDGVTALRKPDGGIRGIVVGDIIRRLIAHTIRPTDLERSDRGSDRTTPVRIADEVRGVSACPHMVQMLTDMNPRQTVLSVDGIGAFDLVSRNAMLQGFGQHARWCASSPVRPNCSIPLLQHTFGRMRWGDPQMIPQGH